MPAKPTIMPRKPAAPRIIDSLEAERFVSGGLTREDLTVVSAPGGNERPQLGEPAAQPPNGALDAGHWDAERLNVRPSNDGVNSREPVPQYDGETVAPAAAPQLAVELPPSPTAPPAQAPAAVLRAVSKKTTTKTPVAEPAALAPAPATRRSVRQRKRDGRTLRQTTIYLELPLAKKLALYCAETDDDKSAVVSRALLQFLGN